MWFGNPTPGYKPRENHNSKGYMHPIQVHCRTVYNSQDMEDMAVYNSQDINDHWQMNG